MVMLMTTGTKRARDVNIQVETQKLNWTNAVCDYHSNPRTTHSLSLYDLSAQIRERWHTLLGGNSHTNIAPHMCIYTLYFIHIIQALWIFFACTLRVAVTPRRRVQCTVHSHTNENSRARREKKDQIILLLLLLSSVHITSYSFFTLRCIFTIQQSCLVWYCK